MDMRKAALVLLFIGIIDSIYLTVVHYLPGALDCPTIGTLVNCETVLTSAYSTVFGVPLAIIGLAWACMMFAIIYFRADRIVRNLWMLVGLGGFVYSITSEYLLGKICVYCTLLDLVIILTLVVLVYPKKTKK